MKISLQGKNTVTVGLERLMGAIAPRSLGKTWLVAAHKAGLYLVKKAKETYPPPPPDQSRYRGRFKGDKMEKARRWWWANMHKIAKGQKEDVPESLRGWKAAYKKIDGKRQLVLRGQYKRTGTMVRSITHTVTYAPPLTALVSVGPGMARSPEDGGSEVGYARLVIGGPDDQAYIHIGRWQPLEELVQQHKEDAIDIFYDTLVVEIGKAIKEGFKK